MSLRDLIFGTDPEPELLHRGAIMDAITAAIAAREAAFSMDDALRIPAVARSVDLITSLGQQFVPVEYVAGAAALDQPRFVRRPDPYSTRAEFIEQTLLSMIEDGEWFWRIGERTDRGYPGWALVLPTSDVQVRWDDRRFQRVYTWRGQTLRPGIDIVHGAIGRRAGDLHGRSALREGLGHLAAIDAAERYAAAAFGSNGIPMTVLRVAGKMTADEATALKAQWARSRQDTPYEPAVASGGVEPEFPAVDPQKMQMQEARAYGATVVGRLLGIPAPLLHIETSGATITYTNEEASLDALVKATIIPRYLSVIEAQLSDLVPRSRVIRFTVDELHRADVTTRYQVYESAIGSGIISPAEARALEGMAPAQAVPAPVPAFASTPAREPDPLAITLQEVPANA